uniref:Uncharacterized protein n=1 Tax=Elaeophora elaphi TaxID=1147741 RepID=A0A0R3RXW6_9BILA
MQSGGAASSNGGRFNRRMSNQDIFELNSAYFSLRVALIFLIVTVIIFIIMQLIKLAFQIMKIRNAAEPFDSQAPELVVHSRKSKRRRRPMRLLPSKTMRIQLSLKNEQEMDATSVDRETVSKRGMKGKAPGEAQEETNIVTYDEIQNFSDNLLTAGIKDSLALFGSKDQSLPTPMPIKKKATSSNLTPQDSLMVVNSQIPLQPFHNAEKLEKKDSKCILPEKSEETDHDKSALIAAKAQDSLMVVNDLKPLQPSASAEQANIKKLDN